MTPDDFADIAPIHDSALPDYKLWVERLRKWNQRINLVSPAAMSDVWRRHVLDSVQLWAHIPNDAKIIADFGSGAGFPGLSLGIEAKHAQNGQTVHLLESVGKKASFLRTVSRETNLPCHIWSERIEAVNPLDADIITARAFAPLTRLLPMAARHISPNGALLLLKGKEIDREIEAAGKDWRFETSFYPSLSDSDGVIVKITNLRPK